MTANQPTPTHKGSERKVTRKGIPRGHQIISRAETSQARGKWHKIVQVLKGKILQSRVLYPARSSFRIEGKNFSDKNKFSNTKPTLKKFVVFSKWKRRVYRKGKIPIGKANI